MKTDLLPGPPGPIFRATRMSICSQVGIGPNNKQPKFHNHNYQKKDVQFCPTFLLLWYKIIDLVWPLSTPRHYDKPIFSGGYSFYSRVLGQNICHRFVLWIHNLYCGFITFLACAHQNMSIWLKNTPPATI